MGDNFVRLHEPETIAELINLSKLRPVVVFKHSLTCPVSAEAYEQMIEFGQEVALIEVQTSRELSREIERRTGITHESPQVILLRNGEVVWTASHFDVKADAITKALKEHGSTGPEEHST